MRGTLYQTNSNKIMKRIIGNLVTKWHKNLKTCVKIGTTWEGIRNKPDKAEIAQCEGASSPNPLYQDGAVRIHSPSQGNS